MNVSCKMSLLFLLTVGQMIVSTAVAQPSTGLNLDGRWVLGEEGDSPEQLIEISGLTGTIQPVRPIDGKEPDPLTVAVEEGPSRFSLTIPYTRYPYQVRLFGPSYGVAWQRDDDDLLFFYRLESPSPELEGDWVVMAEGDVGTLSIDGTNLTITIAGEEEVGEVYQTGADPPFTNLVMLSLAQQPGVLHLIPLNENAYLAHENGDDDLVFLYRADAQPDWLDAAEWGHRGGSEGSESAP